ncbi:hypothetical protein GPECTOR_1g899 [Gonium pectorale]|uniref:Beta-lactamase-related domain-containing protein n=1 Tax=Gonium pectorale TaxID=33097 RepID=A0A150H4L2_GONPE|nr:hypothetical protein GPECTOR_1g899 [Gonium pectorale]|eukprot:KXZ56994.1 hypothetical protein GPECTOR_1g899 [Gonium pectorale]
MLPIRTSSVKLPSRLRASPRAHRLRYVFIVAACVIGAYTVFFGRSPLALLSRPPGRASPPALPVNEHSLAQPAAARAHPGPGPGTCDTGASPYALRIHGADAFPRLASFMSANLLLLEDLHPSSYWVVRRNIDTQRRMWHTVEWHLAAELPLLPLPPGLMPLFARLPPAPPPRTPAAPSAAPVSPGGPGGFASFRVPADAANCSWERALAHWRAAHAGGWPAADVEQHQRVELDASLGDTRCGAVQGLGHPQGAFFRAALPPRLAPEAGAAEAAEPGGAGRLEAEERVLFLADDRFSGGERLFPMRSQGKVLVALLDRGVLSVGDSVAAHLAAPAWQEPPYRDMTLTMLLSHTSGYDNAYHDSHVFEPGNITLLESAMRTMGRINVSAPPGTRFLYSEVGYQVLGAVVEAATGRSFNELLEELVLRPAGLCSTRIVNFWADTVPARGPLLPGCLPEEQTDPKPEPGASEGADDDAGGSVSSWSINPSVAVGGITSANDLSRLLGLLANGGRAVCCEPGSGSGSRGAGDSDVGGGGGGLSPGGAARGGRKGVRGGGLLGRAMGGLRRVGANASARRRCRCGDRVVSAVGVAAVLSRQPTPHLNDSDLVGGFRNTAVLTAQLLYDMKLMDLEAKDAWERHAWGSDWGYGYGLWLNRPADGGAGAAAGPDTVWLLGAFNTAAGLVRMRGRDNGTVLARAQAAHGGDGRVAVVGASLALINQVWTMLTGYLAL